MNAGTCRWALAYINPIRRWLFNDNITSVIEGGSGDFHCLAIANRVAVGTCVKMVWVVGSQKKKPKLWRTICEDRAIGVYKIEEKSLVRAEQKVFSLGQVHQMCIDDPECRQVLQQACNVVG